MKIELETITLTRYDEGKHRNMMEELDSKESKSRFIHNIKDRLIGSASNKEFSYASAYVIEENDIPVGYTYLSPMKNDVVFIEMSLLKQVRGKGLGSRILTEFSDYLFTHHNIKEVRADVDPSNEKSMNMLLNCGFSPDEEEFAERGYTGKMEFVKDSYCYESKRRKY